jgi:hypothetical protein
VGEIWRVIGTIRADGRAALIVDRTWACEALVCVPVDSAAVR